MWSSWQAKNYTPLISACQGGHLDLVHILLKHGAVVTQTTVWEPLCQCMSSSTHRASTIAGPQKATVALTRTHSWPGMMVNCVHGFQTRGWTAKNTAGHRGFKDIVCVLEEAERQLGGPESSASTVEPRQPLDQLLNNQPLRRQRTASNNSKRGSLSKSRPLGLST